MKKIFFGLVMMVFSSGASQAASFQRGCVALEFDDRSEEPTAVFDLVREFRRCRSLRMSIPLSFEIVSTSGGGGGGESYFGEYRSGGAGLVHKDLPQTDRIEIYTRFNKADDIIVYSIDENGRQVGEGLLFRKFWQTRDRFESGGEF